MPKRFNQPEPTENNRAFSALILSTWTFDDEEDAYFRESAEAAAHLSEALWLRS